MVITNLWIGTFLSIVYVQRYLYFIKAILKAQPHLQHAHTFTKFEKLKLRKSNFSYGGVFNLISSRTAL